VNPQDYNPLIELDTAKTVKELTKGYKVAGRYVLEKILGHGGMGVVWMAFDELLKRYVALKVLPDALRSDETALNDLKNEVLTSQKISNDHIVKIFDFVEDSQSAGISMELIDGLTLSTLRLYRPNKIFESSDEDLRICINHLGIAMQYAHKEGVIHRDIKPSNLMVDKRGILKVTDFGISCSITDSINRITKGAILKGGTPPYMSPQQALGKPATPLDDIYSIGATIYDLLTGKPPFLGYDIFNRLQTEVPPPMSERRKELGIRGRPISKRWEEVIAATLDKDPSKRPQTVQELVSLLLKKRPKTKVKTEQISKTSTIPEISPVISPVEEITSDIDKEKKEKDSEPTIQEPIEKSEETSNYMFEVPTALKPETSAILDTKQQDIKPPTEKSSTTIEKQQVDSIPVSSVDSSTKVEPEQPPESEIANYKVDELKIKGPLEVQPPKPVITYEQDRKPEPINISEIGKKVFYGVAALLIIFIIGFLIKWLITRPEGTLIVKFNPRDAPVKVNLTEVMPEHLLLRIIRQVYPKQSSIEPVDGLAIFRNVNSGKCLLTVNSDIYEPVIKDLQVFRNKTNELLIDLKIGKGTFRFVNTLLDAEVFVNGEKIDLSLGSFTTNAGRYELYAVHPDLPTQKPTDIIQLKNGEVKKVEFNFKYGVLNVNSDPEGFIVLIGDKQIGKTPLKKDVVQPGLTSLIVQSPDARTLLKTNIEIIENRTINFNVPGFIHIPKLVTSDIEYYIDDKKISPEIDLIEIIPGVYQIRAERQGWAKQIKEVVVKSFQTNEVFFEYRYGSVAINTIPSGAIVYKNNSRLGVTPYLDEEAIPGKVTYTLELSGYEVSPLTVDVVGGKKTEANIILTRQTGDIFVETVPTGATVIMNNKITMKTPAFFKELVTGNYSIEILCPRFEKTNFSISLSKGQQITNKIILTPSEGTFTVNVEPKTAEISIFSIDDKKQVMDVVAMKKRKVQVGKYEISATARGYYSERKEFVIDKDSHYDVKVVLKPVIGSIVINLLSPTNGVNFSLDYFNENLIKFNTNGNVPITLNSVPVGKYRLKLSCSYYEQTNLVVNILDGKTETIDVKLAREFGELDLSIVQTNLPFYSITNARYSLVGPSVEKPVWFKSPENKKVSLGGMIKESLPTGNYQFYFDMEDFAPVKISLTIPTSGVINLVRNSGDIVLISSTPGIEYELLGPLNKPDTNKFKMRLIADRKPIKYNQLPTGDYKVISKLNYKLTDPITFEQKEKLWLNESIIAVEHNRVTTNVSIVPIGWIRIETYPDKSMLCYGKDIKDVAPKLLGPFEVGSQVNIVVKNKGYKFQTVKFDIKEPQTTNIQTIKLNKWSGPQQGDIIWTNSLGMRFVPVEGLTNIWFSVWECRIKDYERFAYANSSASGTEWRNSKFTSSLSLDHPVVFITKEQAKSFCDWLSDFEHKNKTLEANYRFRLPTIQEWQIAAGKTAFPWGDTFPPPPMAGNYGSTYSYSKEVFYTAPVGRYAPNRNGLYDIGGNVREWCLDGKNIACGGSFNTYYFEEMLITYLYEVKDSKANDVGFRCILELTGE